MSAATIIGALIADLTPKIIELARTAARKLVGDDNTQALEDIAKRLVGEDKAEAFRDGVGFGIALATLAHSTDDMSAAFAAAEKAGRDRMDFPSDRVELNEIDDK